MNYLAFKLLFFATCLSTSHRMVSARIVFCAISWLILSLFCCNSLSSDSVRVAVVLVSFAVGFAGGSDIIEPHPVMTHIGFKSEYILSISATTLAEMLLVFLQYPFDAPIDASNGLILIFLKSIYSCILSFTSIGVC